MSNNYSNKSSSDLQAELEKHRKDPHRTRPDEEKKNKRVKSKKQEIKNLKFKLAELKYDNDEIQKIKGQFQQKQNEWQTKVNDSRDKLKALKLETQAVTKQLREAMGSDKNKLRRIAKPAEKLQELQSQLASEKQRLRCDDLTTGEEKKAMRNIKVLEGQIELVKKYQSQNVEEVFLKGDEAKKNQEGMRKEHNAIFEEFKNAKDANTAIFEKLRKNNSEQEDTKTKIKTLTEQVKTLEQNFKTALIDFDDWRRKEAEILNALTRSREREKYSKGPARNASTNASSSTSSPPQEAKKSAEEENVPTVKELRDAAQREYEAIQAKLRSKQPTAPPSAADPAEESTPATKESDPHSAEKELCQQLIAYCKSNMPAEASKSDSSPKKKKKKRKKKKIRLTHKPINFTNFAKVGVGIPIWSTDLEKCIKALEDKISSYDNPEEQEDVKEQSV